MIGAFAIPYGISIQTMGHDLERIKEVIGERTAKGWKFIEDQSLDTVELVSPILVSGRQEMEYIASMTRRMMESGIKVLHINLVTKEMVVKCNVHGRTVKQ